MSPNHLRSPDWGVINTRALDSTLNFIDDPRFHLDQGPTSTGGIFGKNGRMIVGVAICMKKCDDDIEELAREQENSREAKRNAIECLTVHRKAL